MKQKRVSNQNRPAPAPAAGAARDEAAQPELEDLRLWLSRHQTPPGRALPDPEALNHAVLADLPLLNRAAGIRPCALEKRGGPSHQHQRRLAPRPPGEMEPHITLHSLALWLRAARVDVAAYIQRIVDRLGCLWLLLLAGV